MTEERSLLPHYILRTVILAGFSIYIAYLSKSGSLMYYIAPRMENYVKYAAIALFILAVHQAYMALGIILNTSESSCGCDHDHDPPRSFLTNSVIYGLFILPLLLGFLLPNTIMASNIASTKGMNLSTNTVAQSNDTTSKRTSTPTILEKPQVSDKTISDPLKEQSDTAHPDSSIDTSVDDVINTEKAELPSSSDESKKTNIAIPSRTDDEEELNR